MKLLVSLALFMTIAAQATAQPADPFTRESKWATQESWNNDKLVYTFQPNGTFRSSKTPNSPGAWMRDGNSFVMLWPSYDYAVYVGTINGGEIRGSGFSRDGKSFGTFVLRLMP